MKQSVKRSILSNIVSLGSIDFIGMLLPIVVMPWLTRSLGPIQYGEYLLFMSILIFAHTIIDYGVQFVGVRAVARETKNPKNQLVLYAEYQGLRFILMLVFLLITLGYYLYLGSQIKLMQLLLFGIPYLLGYWLLTPWFLIAKGYNKLLLLSNLIPKLLAFFGIISLVREPQDLNIVLALSTWPVFLAGLYVVFILAKQRGFKLVILNSLTEKLKEGASVFLGLLAPNMYNALPFILIASYVDPIQYSQYGIAMRVTGVVLTIQMVLSKAVYPFLASSSKNHLKAVTVGNLLAVGPLIVVLLFWGEPLLLLVLGSWTVGETNYLAILTVSLLFIVVSNSIGQGYLLPHDHDKLYRNISIRTSLVSAVITVFLIAYLGVLGAAFALLLARVLFALDFAQAYFRIRRAM